MDILNPTDDEKKLCSAVESGKKAVFDKDEVISAEVIRRIVLGLPFRPDRESLGSEIKALFGRGRDPQECGQVAAGLSIRGAVIRGPLDLASVIAEGGGPMCPLEFESCRFEDRFCGAHSHFSRLSFRDCRFRDPPGDDDLPLVPTIDLSGATISSGLLLRGIRPERPLDRLWIRAPDSRIEGALDLSFCHLRAPRDDEARRAVADHPVAALDLARADVRGDFYFLNGARSEGRIYGRGVHIRGDLWLSGSVIKVDEGDALFLQGATIDGMAMLNNLGDRADGSGPRRQFMCAGNLNLRAAEIGDDLHIEGALVAGRANFLDITVGNDLILGASVRDSIILTGCRIGGSLDLSDLTVGVASSMLNLSNGTIGRSLVRTGPTFDARLIAARSGHLPGFRDLDLVETLWIDSSDKPALVQIGFLSDGRWFWLLDGFSSGLNAALRNAPAIGRKGGVELLRLYGTYACGEATAFPIITGLQRGRCPPFLNLVPGTLPPPDFAATANKNREVEACTLQNGELWRCALRVAADRRGDLIVEPRRIEGGAVVEHMPRFKGPFLLHPKGHAVDEAKDEKPLWVTHPTLRRMRSYAPAELDTLAQRLERHLPAATSLPGTVDLRNLTCETLDDQAGRYWGSRVHIEMNHFVYRHATWEPERRRESKRIWQQFGDLFLRLRVERFSRRRLDRSDSGARLRHRTDYWRTWQIRRNWIYQQFRKSAALSCSSRYSIAEHEYKPQPFEQAIHVARAEGHDEYAAQFEMRKRSIEWRLFNVENRWWLAVLGIVAACLWLCAKRGWGVVPIVLPGLILTLALMYSIPAVWRKLHDWSRTARVLLLGLGFSIIVVTVFFAGGWEVRPLQYLFAALIFVTIRLVSWISNVVMRFMFGYLRRPVRAIGSLIGAFLVGWAGVSIANDREMLVIDTEPVAGYVTQEVVRGRPRIRMGSQSVAGDFVIVRNVHCGDTISEPLYALDVLIPLIDLRQESRCEVGRVAGPPGATAGLLGAAALAAPSPAADAAAHKAAIATARSTPLGLRLLAVYRAARDQLARLPASEGFWEVMKALYAIAGWFIVSLSILTFAHANRARGDSA